MYNRNPIVRKNLSVKTLNGMSRAGWYKDMKGSRKFEILNKRFKIDGQWYRTIVRFKVVENGLELDMPLPYVITLSETEDDMQFHDVKVIHGKDNITNTTDYLSLGIPSQLIDAIIQDLKQSTVYLNEEPKEEPLSEYEHIRAFNRGNIF